MSAIDEAAVRAIGDERIDWRFKAMPTEAFGQTVTEFLQSGPDIFDSGFVGPFLVLDNDALEHNLRTMAKWCSRHGIFLAPHGKTTMAPRLFQRQLEHGSWGITAANLSQLRVYRAFGVQRILLANQLVDPAGLRWLAGELDRDRDFSFSCWVDSVDGVRLMTEALCSGGAAPPRQVDVLIELGNEGARTGARTSELAWDIARAVAESPALRLAGVGGYEGAVAKGLNQDAVSTVDSYLRRMREFTGEIAQAGYFAEVDEVIVTAGGSSYFDQVAEALTAPWPDGLNVVPVLRSGAYLSHDDGLYRRMSPFGRQHRLAGDERPFTPAMRIWAQVTSQPEPGLALLTMGRRDAAFDQDLPEPQVLRDTTGTVRSIPEGSCQVTSLADQHAFLAFEPPTTPAVGDWIGFGLSHPCTTFDKWPLIPVVEGTKVVDLVRTYF